MAWEGKQILIPGLVASTDYTAVANQYKFVKMSAAGTVALCAAATDIPIGVLQNRPYTGEGADVCAIGVTKVASDAGLSVGNLIGTSADGQADAKTAGSDTTEYVVGQVIQASGAAAGLAVAVVNCASPHRAS